MKTKINILKWMKSRYVSFLIILLMIIISFTFLTFGYFFDNKEGMYRLYNNKQFLDDILAKRYTYLNTNNTAQKFENQLQNTNKPVQVKKEGERYLFEIQSDDKYYYYSVVTNEKKETIHVRETNENEYNKTTYSDVNPVDKDNKPVYKKKKTSDKNSKPVDKEKNPVDEESKPIEVDNRTDLEKLKELKDSIPNIPNDILGLEEKNRVVTTLNAWYNDTMNLTDHTTLSIFGTNSNDLDELSKIALSKLLNNKIKYETDNAIKHSSFTTVLSDDKIITKFIFDISNSRGIGGYPVRDADTKNWQNTSVVSFPRIGKRPYTDFNNKDNTQSDDTLKTSVFLCSLLPKELSLINFYTGKKLDKSYNKNDIDPIIKNNQKFLIIGPLTIKWTISRAYRNDNVYLIFIIDVDDKYPTDYSAQLKTRDNYKENKFFISINFSPNPKYDDKSNYLPSEVESNNTNSTYHVFNYPTP